MRCDYVHPRHASAHFVVGVHKIGQVQSQSRMPTDGWCPHMPTLQGEAPA
ncbi:hypothetical protein BIFGAL_03097 [Bifidobacterium gallicum DSM 20093 = LMG 11596]|uniref:Uncharacterized protein n=1 Tax=Bifidobacterium gallicum DSM 20093 = LMG 11596 TaxID=561180 RepID=D1NTE0_9BIFI|nr:hypothetical protein BIFGAL_03097 [Bifidobacterium gallicum DSM 20093 = LMG 11596]